MTTDFRPGIDLVHVAGGVYGHEEGENVMAVMASQHLTAGMWHDRLERELALWYGVRYARLVNSGSSANLLAVTALTSPLLDAEHRLVPGDEVITVAAGFPTTVAPIIQNGLIPVFVDVTLPSVNIGVSMLEAARSSRTRAVMVAHTLGNPFDLTYVKDFCDRNHLYLIEDCCDAAGSLWEGKKVGTFGHLATLSFYPAHHMTTGEGGAVLTSHPTLQRAVTSLRDWGRDCWCAPAKDNTCGKRFAQQHGTLPVGFDHKYVSTHLGYNLKMTDMQAAVGCAQLQKLNKFCSERRLNWKYLHDSLDGLPGLTFSRWPAEATPSWFGFLVLVEPAAPFSRDDLVQRLEARRIQTRMLFAGNMTRQPAMRGRPYRVIGDLARTDFVMRNAFWVGVYPGLTPPMLWWMVTSFKEICR
jgi:CDP-6-deoxy-D-xylo-4-hexulose-3-dehydrase